MYQLNYPKLNDEFKQLWKEHSKDVNFKKKLHEKLYDAEIRVTELQKEIKAIKRKERAELKTIELKERIAQLEAVNDSYVTKMTNLRYNVEGEAKARRKLLTRFNNYKRSVESILSQFRCTVKNLKSA